MNDAENYDVLTTFTRTIFHQGLFNEINQSTKKTLVSRQDGIFIGSMCICGRLMASVSNCSEEHEVQVTFICPEDEPQRLNINSFAGSYDEILDMLKLAAKRFESGSPVMHHETIVFAGVEIGK